jgi:hypothetical protein
MPALSTQGLAAGLQAGYGMARQSGLDRQAQQRYEQEQLAKQQAIQTEQARYDQEFARDTTRYETEQERLAAQDQATAQYRSDTIAANNARTELERTKFDRDQLKEAGKFYMGSALLPDFKVDTALEGQLEAAGLQRFLPSSQIDTENLTVLNNLDRMGREMLRTGDVGRANTPEFLDLFNKAFDREISTGEGQVDAESGKVVKDKRVIGFQDMGNGKFTTQVALVYEDGTQSQPRPVTLFRSADPNDPVTAEDPDAMIKMVLGRAEVARRIGENKTTIQSAYDLITGKNDKAPTGQTMPANAKMIEYLVQNGMDRDEATTVVTQSKGNPMNIAATVAGRMVTGDVTGERTFETVYPTVLSTLQGLGTPTPSAVATAPTEQPTEQPPQDDTELRRQRASALGLTIPGQRTIGQ